MVTGSWNLVSPSCRLRTQENRVASSGRMVLGGVDFGHGRRGDREGGKEKIKREEGVETREKGKEQEQARRHGGKALPE